MNFGFVDALIAALTAEAVSRGKLEHQLELQPYIIAENTKLKKELEAQRAIIAMHEAVAKTNAEALPKLHRLFNDAETLLAWTQMGGPATKARHREFGKAKQSLREALDAVRK